MNYKIRVNPEESKQIQEICFGMGIYWPNNVRNVLHCSSEFIFFTNKYIFKRDCASECLDWEDCEFIGSDFTEISAQVFIKKYGQKTIPLGNYMIGINPNSSDMGLISQIIRNSGLDCTFPPDDYPDKILLNFGDYPNDELPRNYKSVNDFIGDNQGCKGVPDLEYKPGELYDIDIDAVLLSDIAEKTKIPSSLLEISRDPPRQKLLNTKSTLTINQNN